MMYKKYILFVLWRLICILPSSNANELNSFGFNDVSVFDFITYVSNGKHRMRRSIPDSNVTNTRICDDNDLPQPTIDYPLVLFEDLNFNDCFTTGKYTRLKADEYVEWAHNKPPPDRGKIMTWNSMIMFPGVNVTFRGCCPSGNNFVSIVSNWTQKTADMNATIHHYPRLSGSDGIWYKDWLYWQMSFHLKVSVPQDTSVVKSCGTCKFNQCGITGKCECLSGYTGSTCETSPSNMTYPTEQYPLLLFEDVFFAGNVKHLKPGESLKFAGNEQGAFGGRKVYYKSMRVYYNQTVIFQRDGSRGKSIWSPANDVHNFAEFLESNLHIADPIWYSYDNQILLKFTVKVV